ncbi:MAG TPA: hypothetical protein VG246_06085, partial [Acidimicrobiales bacterium]|nr:hypothetical protein [Acidimicrobiales bacterium]
MTAAERRTYPVPFGQHVYVMSDLSLSPTTDTSSRPIRELLNLLGDVDNASIVVIAGNLFHPDHGDDLVTHIDDTLTALPRLRNAIQRFCAVEGHRLVVLPGCDDRALRDEERAQSRLQALGICLASDLVLQVATANGVRDLAVTVGNYDLNVEHVNGKDVADADRLEDPS